MAPVATLLRALLATVLASVLCGCIEIAEHRRFDTDGTLHFKAVMTIDPQFEALVMPELRKKFAAERTKGWKVDLTQRIDGKAAAILEAEGDVASAELGGSDQPFKLAISDAGFMRRKYDYRMRIAKNPETPMPHRIKVTLPGSIGQTNGNKLNDDTVEFDVTSARRGASFFASSTGFALSFPGASSMGATGARAGSVNWAPWTVGVVAAVFLGLMGWLWRRRARPDVAALPARHDSSDRRSAATPSPDAASNLPPPATIPTTAPAHVFCTECGTKNAAPRKFCLQCGRPLE